MLNVYKFTALEAWVLYLESIHAWYQHNTKLEPKFLARDVSNALIGEFNTHHNSGIIFESSFDYYHWRQEMNSGVDSTEYQEILMGVNDHLHKANLTHHH